VPHLRDGFIVAKVGHRAKHDPSEPGYPHWARFIQKVETVTRPAPVFRFLDEASRDRIAMHVFQLLHSLVVSEDVEVIVAGLPEGSRSEAFGDGKFEGLQGL
jgi:hypothetical protein